MDSDCFTLFVLQRRGLSEPKSKTTSTVAGIAEPLPDDPNLDILPPSSIRQELERTHTTGLNPGISNPLFTESKLEDNGEGSLENREVRRRQRREEKIRKQKAKVERQRQQLMKEQAKLVDLENVSTSRNSHRSEPAPASSQAPSSRSTTWRSYRHSSEAIHPRIVNVQ